MAGVHCGYRLGNLDSLMFFSSRVQVVLAAKLTQLMEQNIISEAITAYDLINFNNGRLRPDYLAIKFKLPMFGGAELKFLADKILADIISEVKNNPWEVPSDQNVEINFLFDLKTESYYCLFMGSPELEALFKSFPEVEEFYDSSNPLGLTEADLAERKGIWSRLLPELREIDSAVLTLTIPNGYATLPRGFDTFDFAKLHLLTVSERLLLLVNEFLAGEFKNLLSERAENFDFDEYSKYVEDQENQARVISALAPLMGPEITAEQFI